MRINLGSGSYPLEGWLNIDAVDMNLGKFPWDFDDECADELMASHVLEHFTRRDGVRFIGECYRILKPGGVLHIAVPDMDRFITAHLENNFDVLKGYHWRDLNHLMGGDGGEPNPLQRHRYMYCMNSLAMTLAIAGFRVEKRFAPLDIDNHRYKPISLYVDAIKTQKGETV